MAVAIEDAGFEIRDQIMWIYGSGFPKSHNISKGLDKSQRGNRVIELIDVLLAEGATLKELGEKSQIPSLESSYRDWVSGGHRPEERSWERLLLGLGFSEKDGLDIISRKTVSLGGGNSYTFREGEKRNWEVKETAPATPAAKQWEGWGTALKPAHEPMVLARKPLVGTVAANVLTYGTGGLNIDGARVGYGEELIDFDARQITSQRNEDAIQFGGIGANGTNVSMYKESGRWPANVIHDGSDEVVALFPNSKGNGATGGGEGGIWTTGNKQQVAPGYTDSGSAARFFYCAKASKRDRNEGLDGFEIKELRGGGGRVAAGYDESTQDLKEAARKFGAVKTAKANHHPTVKPTDLMRYLCRLITPPNGTVLDPFMGSGSTGKAAMYEGFKFIGVEMTDEYLPIAKARIEFAVSDNEGFLL
jgi:hypothetical protein